MFFNHFKSIIASITSPFFLLELLTGVTVNVTPNKLQCDSELSYITPPSTNLAGN